MPFGGGGWGGSGGGDFGGMPGGSSSSGSGFNWSALAGILPLLGGLFGNQSGNINQSLQQMQGNESQMMSQLLQMITGNSAMFGSTFAPVLGQLGSQISAGLGQNANNLGQSNAVYAQEAATGLSPQVMANAQNQLLQGFQSSLSDINAQATPGSAGNIAAQRQAAQDQYLGQATNLSGTLAGESQQYKQSGAQGLASNYFGEQQAAQGFGNAGIGLQESSMNSLAQLFNSYAQQMAAYAQSAQQQPSTGSQIGGILGGLMNFLPMFGL